MVVGAGQDDCFFDTAAVAGLVMILVGLGADWAVCVAVGGGGYRLGPMGAPGGRLGQWLAEGKVLSYPVDLWGRLVLVSHRLET